MPHNPTAEIDGYASNHKTGLVALPSFLITLGTTLMAGGVDLDVHVGDRIARKALSIDHGKINALSAIGVGSYVLGWLILLFHFIEFYHDTDYLGWLISASLLVPLSGTVLYLVYTLKPRVWKTVWWIAAAVFSIGWYIFGLVMGFQTEPYSQTLISLLFPLLAIVGTMLMILGSRWCLWSALGQMVYYYAWALFAYHLVFN